MRIAILSDIHSNKFALQSVLNEIDSENIKDIIILGDTFGYYPWASDTYNLLKTRNIIGAIKGNHDELILQFENEQYGKLEYYSLALQNKAELELHAPDAITWLGNLKSICAFRVKEVDVTICHGTPDDSLNGRFYPDNSNIYDWFPMQGQVLMLGHTHYPFYKKTQQGGVILNPGAVGQPRDGSTLSSWGVWDLDRNEIQIKRTAYDFRVVIKNLEKINWNKRAIFALAKNYTGNIQI